MNVIFKETLPFHILNRILDSLKLADGLCLSLPQNSGMIILVM